MKFVIGLFASGAVFAIAAFVFYLLSAKAPARGVQFYVASVMSGVLWAVSWVGAMCLALLKEMW